MMAVYDKDVVERYVMHLIALKGYPRENGVNWLKPIMCISGSSGWIRTAFRPM